MPGENPVVGFREHNNEPSVLQDCASLNVFIHLAIVCCVETVRQEDV
jgi:hypothetical protein